MATAFPYDILIDGKGYMLARADQLGRSGRAWQVELQGASIAQEPPGAARWGNQPASIELPVVWSTAHLGYGEDRQQTVGRYHYAVGMDARFPGMILPGPEATVVSTGLADPVTKFAEIGGSLLFLAGRYVKRFTSAGAIADERDLGSGMSGVDMEVFNGNLYVGLGFGSGAYIHRRTAAGTWSQDDDVLRGHMVVLSDRLWASSGTAEVKSVAADPMTAADWSAGYKIGDPGAAITALAAVGDLLYIGKEEGLFALDATGVAAQLTPELRPWGGSENCRGMRPWHGALWVPHRRGLYRYEDLGDTGFHVTSAQPGREAVDNPVRGQVTALAGDDHWLYAALWTGSDSYILAGRETAEGMIWHPILFLAGRQCLALHISGLWSSPRLFFGAGPDVGYIILPRQADNPLSDPDCRYATSGRFYYASHDSGVPATTKLYKSIEVHAEGLDAYNWIDVYLALDDGQWQYAGRADRSPVSMLPLDPRGLAGKRLRIRLNYHLQASTSRFRVLDVVARAAERPELVAVVAAVIRCADRLPTNGPELCPRTGAEMAAELRALAELHRSVTLVDPAGGTRQVLVLGPVQEQEVEQEGRLAQELLLTVRMAVFSEEERAPETRTVVFLLGGAADGFTVPTPVPTPIGASSAACAQVVTYEGSAPSRPIIRVTGPITDIVIRNETTGEKLDFQGTAIAAGDTWLIDMHLATPVVVDGQGVDRSGALTADSSLMTFRLVPGDNAFYIAGSGIDERTGVTMEYWVHET